jgi:TIR domain
MLKPVFISFAEADKDIANAICVSLEAAGLTAWISTRDVEIGRSYAEGISAALRDASALVLVLSAESIRSPHVASEVAAAGRRDVSIIVYREQEIAAPPAIESYVGTLPPSRSGIPREMRIAGVVAEVLAALDLGATAARSVEAPPSNEPLDRELLHDLGRKARESVSPGLRRFLVVGGAVAAFCVFADFVALQDQLIGRQREWLVAVEHVGIADYLGATTALYLAVAMPGLFILRSWLFGVTLGVVLTTGAGTDLIGEPVFSLRRPLQPAVAVRTVRALAGSMETSSVKAFSWWLCMLISSFAKALGLALAAFLVFTPAIVVFALMLAADVLLFVGCVLTASVTRPIRTLTPVAGG